MKIRNIYLGKGIPFVCLAITALCIIITLISQLIPSTYIAFTFMYPIDYPWQIFTYVFLQGIPQEMLPPDFPYSSMELTIGHLGFNLLLIMPFGILVEKIIRSKKMLILIAASWVADLIANLIMGAVLKEDGEPFCVSGASGVAFCFMPVGMYAIFLLGKRYGFGKLFKQVSFYLLMPIAILTLLFSISPDVKGVTGIPSMIIHLLALLIGVIFCVVFRKTIKGYIYKDQPQAE